jgi:two-component system sensor histidine kinase VicK
LRNTRPDPFAILHEIGNSSNDGLLIYEREARTIRYTNEVATKLLGLRQDDTDKEIKARFLDVRSEDKAYLQDRLALLKETGIIPSAEFRIKSGDEQERTLCIQVHFVSGHSHLVIFINDLTLARQHQDYLLEFGTKKNTLLETLAHHISGALTLIQHLSIEAKKSLEARDHKNMETYLGLVTKNTETCLDIIADLLQNEKRKGATISVRDARIDIVEKIGFIHYEVSQSFKNRTFHYDRPVHPIFMMIDEIKLLQVMNILISNAVKFTPPNQPITISIAATSKEVTVSVADKGIGIPDSLKPFIFEKGGIAGRVGLNGEKSTGYGLSISKLFVEAMDGKIWFESKEGEGSKFFFSLPKKVV